MILLPSTNVPWIYPSHVHMESTPKRSKNCHPSHGTESSLSYNLSISPLSEILEEFPGPLCSEKLFILSLNPPRCFETFGQLTLRFAKMVAIVIGNFV